MSLYVVVWPVQQQMSYSELGKERALLLAFLNDLHIVFVSLGT